MLQTLFALYLKNVMYMISPFPLFRLSLLYYAFSFLTHEFSQSKALDRVLWDVYFI